MAVAGLGQVGSGSASSAATTLAVTNTSGAIIPAGTLLVIAGTWDNINSVTAPTITASAAGGVTPTANHATAVGQGVTTTAGAGVWHQCFRVLTTADIATGATITTLTSNQSAVKRVATVTGFSGALATLRGTVASAASSAGTATVNTAGTSPSAGDLVIGTSSVENNAVPSADADTTNGAWSTMAGIVTSGGQAATNVGVGIQYKIPSATGLQTYNPVGANDQVTCVFALLPVPDPAISQAAYQWFGEGTESGATALAAQSTAVTGNISNGDATGTLRIRLQETGSGPVPATDDWQLQYEKNLSGTWVNVSASSVAASTYDSPLLTNGQATTNRLTGGTGTFVPGKVSEDSLMDDLGWGTSNYTELVYALKIKAADLVNGDTLRFRVLRNNATTTMTYTATPRIDLVKIDPAVTQASYGFFADGPEASATPLGATSTAITADVAAADVPLQVRVRLQSTSAANLPATDDWQLQWEKNASGTWADVVAAGGGAPELSDSFEDAAATNFSVVGGTNIQLGQSFLGDGKALARAGFHLASIGTNVGSVTAELYAHTGTFGSAGTATGVALATSTTSVDQTSITADPTYTWYEFDFDGTYVLEAGTPYVIAVAADFGSTDNLNAVRVHRVAINTPHPGNAAVHPRAGAWSGSSYEIEFRVYTLGSGSTVVPYASPNLTDDAATTIFRTGAGTGTAVSGRVCEDGLVSDFGWVANGWTEHLYSVALKKDDLANSDVIRLRVARNGAPLDSYTQTPTLTVSKVSSGTTYTATGSLAVTTTVAAAATRTTLSTTTALTAFTLVTAFATRTTPSPTTALALTTTATAAATAVAGGTVYTTTTLPLAVTTTVAAAATRTTTTPSTALTVTTSRTAAATRTTTSPTTSLAVTTSRTAAATRSTFTTSTALAVTTTRTAAATRTTFVAGTSALSLTLTASATSASFVAVAGALTLTATLTAAATPTKTTTSTALAITTSRTASASRTTLPSTTTLVVTTLTTAAALRAAAPAVAALGATTTVTAAAVRTAAPATAALAVTVTQTATAVRTAAPALAALAVTTSSTATALRSSFVSGVALAVTTSRAASATRTTLASSTALPVVTSRSASVVKATSTATTALAVTTTFLASPTPGGAVGAALAVTTTRTAAATRTTLTPSTALAVVTSRSAAASRATFATGTALAVTTSRTASATRATFTTSVALAVTTSRIAAASRTTTTTTTALLITTVTSAVAARETLPSTVALTVTTTTVGTLGRETLTTTTALSVTTTLSTDTDRLTLIPTVALSVVTTATAALSVVGVSGAGGKVFVGGTTKTVAARWVVIGGVKKPVVTSCVVVGGVKHAVK